MKDQRVIFSYEDHQAQRLDKFLVSKLPDFSRSRIQNWIKDGNVLVDGVVARKTGQSLEHPCVVEVTIPPPAPADLVPEDISLDIVFENSDLMVVNKPAGMVVHPAVGHTSGTLVHAALAHAPDMEGVGGKERPGVVHRLDKDTSGLIILAKNDRSHRWMQEQFRLRKVKKVYLALVDGHPPTPVGRVEAAIGRSTKYRNIMAVVSPQQGRQAITEYSTAESFPDHAFLEVQPITGRTHQIRLHLAFLGCPVAGDTIYGRKKISVPLERHFLHAFRLTIQIPGEQPAKTFEAALPEDLRQILNQLRGGLSFPEEGL